MSLLLIPGENPLAPPVSPGVALGGPQEPSLALGRISAGAQWGQESVRAHPQQDAAETGTVRAFLRAVTAAASWLPPQGPCPCPRFGDEEY